MSCRWENKFLWAAVAIKLFLRLRVPTLDLFPCRDGMALTLRKQNHELTEFSRNRINVNRSRWRWDLSSQIFEIINSDVVVVACKAVMKYFHQFTFHFIYKSSLALSLSLSSSRWIDAKFTFNLGKLSWTDNHQADDKVKLNLHKANLIAMQAQRYILFRAEYIRCISCSTSRAALCCDWERFTLHPSWSL